MEYREKLIENISLVYENNEVKLLKKDKNDNDIEIGDSRSKKFRDDLKKELLIQFREEVSCNIDKSKRINKLIDNIDEVIDILLTKSAISIAEKTDLFKDGNGDDIDSRAKRIGNVAFRTDLSFPTTKEIDDKINLIHKMQNRFINKGYYDSDLTKCEQEIELMYCARGELGDQFDDYYIVKLRADVIDDYESKRCISKCFSPKKKSRFLEKIRLFKK